MALIVTSVAELPTRVGALAEFAFEGGRPARPGQEIAADQLARRGFHGAVGDAVVGEGTHGALVVLVGLGEASAVDREVLRLAAAAAVRHVTHCESLAIDLGVLGAALPDLTAGDIAAAVVTGAQLAAYRFDRFKSQSTPDELVRLILVSRAPGDLVVPIARAEACTAAVTLARDLVNAPAGDLTPRRFAEIATEVAAHASLTIEVLGEEAIVAERLGGLLGVAAGSAEPPRFIRLTYEPLTLHGATPTVVLVGKGITFDSGGLSLKSAASMMTMKTDMSGAAAVLATMSALGAHDVAARVVGLMPTTENMPGGRATKPGDVLTIRNDKTIEVLNTDAEGRLVLADALSLAEELAPDAIIDLATLTGACVTALGIEIAGLMGNDDRLIAALEQAGRLAGEPLWPLPLPSGYRKHIDSEIADMKNIGASGQAGALSAALLLAEFVGSVPWAHLDIAGPARSEDDKGYRRKGGTGFGVSTLLSLLESYQPMGGEVPGAAKGMTVLR